MLNWIMTILEDYRLLSAKLLDGVIEDSYFGACALVQVVTKIERDATNTRGAFASLPARITLQLKFTLQTENLPLTPIQLRIVEGNAELNWRLEPGSSQVPHALRWLTDSAIAHLAIELIKSYPTPS